MKEINKVKIFNEITGKNKLEERVNDWLISNADTIKVKNIQYFKVDSYSRYEKIIVWYVLV